METDGNGNGITTLFNAILVMLFGRHVKAGRGVISACVYMIVFDKEVECAPSACL